MSPLWRNARPSFSKSNFGALLWFAQLTSSSASVSSKPISRLPRIPRSVIGSKQFADCYAPPFRACARMIRPATLAPFKCRRARAITLGRQISSKKGGFRTNRGGVFGAHAKEIEGGVFSQGGIFAGGEFPRRRYAFSATAIGSSIDPRSLPALTAAPLPRSSHSQLTLRSVLFPTPNIPPNPHLLELP